MATLFIFSGLPGTGKTTLSQKLAPKVNALHLRIDTIEQGLRDLCHLKVEGEGYRLAYRIAADNLRLGINVVADSCNSIDLTRQEWEQVAVEIQCKFINIEVICSDKIEHRHRIESRRSTIPGLRLPTWQDVQEREYQSWSKKRYTIDTARCSASDCLKTLVRELSIHFQVP